MAPNNGFPGNHDMNSTANQQQGTPAANAADFDGQAGDILSFDDRELELALKAVSWNPRDLQQFLRSCRAQ
jgi:hypothetical protein